MVSLSFDKLQELQKDTTVPFFGDLFGLANLGWGSSSKTNDPLQASKPQEETTHVASAKLTPQGRHHMLRVALSDLDRTIKKQPKTTLGLFLDGNVVRNVLPAGPADRAGLKKGDSIQAVDNFAPAADPYFIGKYLDAVPDEHGASVYLTWLNEDDKIQRAPVEKVDVLRYKHAVQLHMKLQYFDKATEVLLSTFDDVIRDPALEISDDHRNMILEALIHAKRTVNEAAENMEDDVLAILAQQKAFEEEMLFGKAKYEAFRQAHHSRNLENKEQLGEIQELKEIMQSRLRAIGIDELDLSKLDDIKKENEILKELLEEVRDTKATFQYKNKIIMEPREYEELVRRDPAPLLQVIDEQQRVITKLQQETAEFQKAVDKVGELTEITLEQSGEIFRLNEVLSRFPEASTLHGPTSLRGDWLHA